MHETPDDIRALQDLLDRSYADRRQAPARDHHARAARAGRRGRLARLTGMRLLVLATATADGRPIAGPVDGIFYRGAFHFGSAADSIRFRHIRARPHVSATHLPG